MEHNIVSPSRNFSTGSIFWMETLLAAIASMLAVVSALWPDWIEIVFGIDPDHHSGSTEWNVVIAWVLSAMALATLARRSWRKRLSARKEHSHA